MPKKATKAPKLGPTTKPKMDGYRLWAWLKKPIHKGNKPVEAKPYHLEIKVNDVEFKTDAKDLETALTEFVHSPLFPLGSKTMAVVKYSDGKNEGTRILRTRMARRIFKSMSLKPDAITIFAARLTQSLG